MVTQAEKQMDPPVEPGDDVVIFAEDFRLLIETPTPSRSKTVSRGVRRGESEVGSASPP